MSWAAAATFGGSALETLGGLYGQRKQISAQRKFMEQARQDTEAITRSTPVWQTQGLRLAGLNPVLAATKGLGGASMSSAPSAGLMNPASGVANTGLALAKLKEELDIMRAQEKNIRADTKVKGQQARVQDNIADISDIVANASEALTSAIGGRETGKNIGTGFTDRVGRIFNSAKRAHDSGVNYVKKKAKSYWMKDAKGNKYYD